MTTYATAAELADWIWADPAHPFPANTYPAALLRHASSLVDDALRGAVYNTDQAGMPTDIDVLAAVKSATCAMAAAWVTNGLDPMKGVAQLPPLKTSKSAIGVSVSYDHGTARAALEALAGGRQLDQGAWGYLNRAGLITARVGGRAGYAYDRQPIEAKAFDPVTGRFVV